MEYKHLKDGNFITIQSWMITELNLKGNNLIIFAIIFGFSQDGKSGYNGSIDYLAEWTNSSIQGVYKCLNQLIDQQLVFKEKSGYNIIYMTKHNLETIKQSLKVQNDETFKQSLTTFKQSLTTFKQSLTNNINNNIDNNINTTINCSTGISEETPDTSCNINDIITSSSVNISNTDDMLLFNKKEKDINTHTPLKSVKLTNANSDILGVKKNKKKTNKDIKSEAIVITFKQKIDTLNFKESISKALYNWLDILVEKEKLMTSGQFDLCLTKVQSMLKQFKEFEVIDCINNTAMAGYNNFNYTQPKIQQQYNSRPNRTYMINQTTNNPNYAEPDNLEKYMKPGMTRGDAYKIWEQERLDWGEKNGVKVTF